MCPLFLKYGVKNYKYGKFREADGRDIQYLRGKVTLHKSAVMPERQSLIHIQAVRCKDYCNT